MALTDDAYDKVVSLMKKYADFGAMDSEGDEAIERVRAAGRNGNPFPLRGEDPFSLYSSMDGYRDASIALVAAARKYWIALLEERLGVTIYQDDDDAEDEEED